MSVSACSVGAVGLGATLVAVGALVLSPTHPDPTALWTHAEPALDALTRVGVPASVIRLGVFGFACNIVMFVPLGFFGALLLPRPRWWAAALACLVLTCAIETTQGLLLPGRTFDVKDIIGNAAGGLLGAAAAFALRSLSAAISGGASRVAPAR